jgi:Ricin-type beta-trefoil lectin domain
MARIKSLAAMGLFINSTTLGFLASGALVSAVHAQVNPPIPVIASYHARGKCIDGGASGVVLWECHSGGVQAFRFRQGSYGQISLGGNQCLTGGSAGSPLTMSACSFPNASQMWGFQSDGTLRNETGNCADAERGATGNGTRILMWSCNRGSLNQMWYPAVSQKSATVSLATLGAIGTTTQGIIGSRGFSASNLVAAGGGNLVAAGGGNLVAAGGGNLVAAGGGNIVVGGAGSLVAAGGGNLVAAGGGNVVPTNAGNLVAAGGGNFLPNNLNYFSNANAANAGNLIPR